MLKRIVGCTAGTVVYWAARAACFAMNAGRPKRRLDPSLMAAMGEHFPALDLTRVRLCDEASLPANLLASRRAPRADGMTFGWTIFVRPMLRLDDPALVGLVMHELVHVDQVRRLGGEGAFACAYGRGFLDGGGYRENPMEEEAYAFVRGRFARIARIN